MASQTQGIQKLLAAEKRADEKVTQARKRKALRLKKAKEDAQTEGIAYRQDQENKFKEYEAKHMGSRENNAIRIETETKKKIEAMNTTVAQNKGKVIEFMISAVFNVKPQLHENLRLKK